MDLGLLQKEAGTFMGVSVCKIMSWELGHTKPRTGYALEIARFLQSTSEPKLSSQSNDRL